MKHCFTITIPFIIILLIACENSIDNINSDGFSDTLLIQTSKIRNGQKEYIMIELTNYYDSTAYYYKCSSYSGIPPVIYKSENNEWVGYWTPICNGFSSYCCLGLAKGEKYTDLMDIEFEKGTYKIEYQFIIGHGTGYQVFTSNVFYIE